LYTYHVTGSVVPSALFSLGVGSGFVSARVPAGLVAMLIDRMYGLLALAPVYALGLLGLGVMLRTHLRELAIVGSLALALIVPAAGQGYWTDGTVPLRHALAVLPLAAIPIALWLRAVEQRPFQTGIALLLLAISIRTAVVYNLHNDKTITTMIDASVSGWDLSLLLPLESRIRWSPMSFDAGLSLAAAAAVIAALVHGARRQTPVPLPATSAALRAAAGLAGAAAVLAAAGILLIGLGGPTHRQDLLASTAWQVAFGTCGVNEPHDVAGR
jgi:hypothetical protein